MKLYWPAIVLIILGILIVVSPWTIAPVCEVHGLYAKLVSGKDFLMPCGWTGRAEIGIGTLVVVAGVLLAFAKSAETKMMIGILGAVLGILAILFPTVITGMCAMADHPCNLLTKPVLIILGLVVIIVSAFIIYTSRSEMMMEANAGR
jgi:hypothetical protein